MCLIDFCDPREAFTYKQFRKPLNIQGVLLTTLTANRMRRRIFSLHLMCQKNRLLLSKPLRRPIDAKTASTVDAVLELNKRLPFTSDRFQNAIAIVFTFAEQSIRISFVGVIKSILKSKIAFH